MSPSLREIKIFVAVYEERSFTAAALREHATQSGVSQHIRNLEDRLNVQLLARSKGVHPTPAGIAYYKRCVDVLRSHALACRTLEEFSTGLAGEIAVGLPPTITKAVFARAFLRFNSKHPNVGLRVVEAYAPMLEDVLRTGDVDFAILPHTSSAVIGLKNELFIRTPEYLVSRAGCGLVDGHPVCLSDIENIKLIFPAPANGRAQGLHRYCTILGVAIDNRLELDTMSGTLDLVSRSDWRVIFPGLMIANDIGAGEFVINQLISPPLFLDLYVVQPERQPLSAAALAFLDELRHVSEEINGIPIAQIAFDS